jgi:hypothetical protein
VISARRSSRGARFGQPATCSTKSFIGSLLRSPGSRGDAVVTMVNSKHIRGRRVSHSVALCVGSNSMCWWRLLFANNIPSLCDSWVRALHKE